MPKFKVCIQQYVEETAIVEIEAATPEEAADKGDEMARNGDVEEWQDGDDITGRRVYAVVDTRGDIVWEE